MLTPDHLQDYINAHAIAADLLRDVGDTPTVLDAARALGVPSEQIIKTLIFLVDGKPVVYITNGPQRVDPRVLARHFGVGRKKVKLADAEAVLRLTGYPAGGVPPFGHKTAMPVLINARVLTLPVVFGGGGDDRTMVRVAPEELVRVTNATVVMEEESP